MIEGEANRMEFLGKTALVTGASMGIGRATAVLLAQRGARVVLIDINFEKLLSVEKEIKEYTKDVLIYECDISNREKVFEVVKDASTKFGGIDILVNNAALWRDAVEFLNITDEMWARYIDINIMGSVYCIKAVLPYMIERNYGRIINVASVAGVYGNINMVHYSATKGALISMTKALAKEVADKGILVNCVSPGSVSPSGNEDYNSYVETPLCYMGRSGAAMENAKLICFLASDDATYISGQNMQIDGCRKNI